MKLSNTIKRLTDKPTNLVTVVNMDDASTIVCNMKGSDIIEKHGSVEAFFDSIYKSGVTKIKVADRNPHGSTTTPFGKPYIISLIPGEEQETTQAKAKDTKTTTQPPIMPSLNGLQGIGLNAAEAEVYGKLYDYPRVYSELQTAKTDLKALEKENQELKTKLLVNDTLDGKSVERAKANKELVKEAMPLLGMVMQALKPNAIPVAETVGLAGALSAQKHRVVSIISQYDDDTAHHVANFLEKLMDENVWNDFEELLKKNNLIKTDGAA